MYTLERHVTSMWRYISICIVFHLSIIPVNSEYFIYTCKLIVAFFVCIYGTAEMYFILACPFWIPTFARNLLTILLVTLISLWRCYSCELRSWNMVYRLLLSSARGPFYWYVLALIPEWICNQMLSKVWDEFTYPFPNSNGSTVEVWE